MSLVVIIVIFLLRTSTSGHAKLCTSSCGKLNNIQHPFRVHGDNKYLCGRSNSFEIYCENNVAMLSLYSHKYYVEEINYHSSTIRLVDPDVVYQQNYSYLPPILVHPVWYWTASETVRIIFLSCVESVNDDGYVKTSVCMGTQHSGDDQYNYLFIGHLTAKDLRVGCTVKSFALTSESKVMREGNISCADIRSILAQGFVLGWDERVYQNLIVAYAARLAINAMTVIVLFQVTKVIFGTPCVIIFLIYKWRKRHFSMYNEIEEFLQNNNNMMPIRYSYSEIKKITKGFKNKLGQGGFGTVFKGKLRSGRMVAVKMLTKSQANGQDFINEVATIGRIHHVNVVQLVGYCVEGSKRALVYEFMSNGSLDKYIFSKEEDIMFLRCKKIHEIAIEIARGIAYLHQGCDMQILHFDIKPHNILLDDNFTPKISDFGLAKLYSTNENIVSLTAARGTIGYMAPELFYKNIGGVSYKVDVYSFGMLLLEMVSRRRNLNPFAEDSSKIHFPSWAYDQFMVGNEYEIVDADEEEMKLAKKMIIVAFWCIQMKPSDRPSMKKVVEMLESEADYLEMAPRPFLSVQDLPSEHVSVKSKPIGSSSIQSCSSSEYESESESESESLIISACLGYRD